MSKITTSKLTSEIWEAANKLRGSIKAESYKDLILAFIFYKFLSQKIIDCFEEEEISYEEIKEFDEASLNLNINSKWTAETIEDIKQVIISQLGYYIPYKFLFQTWVKYDRNSQNELAFSLQALEHAIYSFYNYVQESNSKTYNMLYRGILNELLKNTQSQTSTQQSIETSINDLIKIIDKIPTTKQDYDLLGYVYEFFIRKFASDSAKADGQYYTPHEVSTLMSELIADHLKDREEISIYDPTCGSGSLLLNIGKEYEKIRNTKNKITYYAQDLLEAPYTTTRMNLLMNGIEPSLIKVSLADTLLTDWPFVYDEVTKTNKAQKLDAVISNPPYSLAWNPNNVENDPRFINYGLAPKSKADFAFLLHSYYHLDTNGIMAIVLPHGVLFRGNVEKDIREKLIKEHAIDTIIGLPDSMFYSTNIATIIMILKKDRINSDGSVQFIDASKLYVKTNSFKKFNASHIKKIVHAVINKLNIDNFSRIVSYEEIVKNDFNLNISRYIDNFEKPEEYDLYSLIHGGISEKEINHFSDFWNVFPSLKAKIFKKLNDKYFEFNNIEALDETILQHDEVIKYQKTFKDNLIEIKEFIKNNFKDFNDFNDFDKNKLQLKFDKLYFEQGIKIDLLDKYELYQLICDILETVYEDIKFISTLKNSKEFIKENANELIETKFSKNKDKVVSWKSNLIESEIFNSHYFKDLVSNLEDLKLDEENIKQQITDITEEFSEDEKDELVKNNVEIKQLNKKASELKTQIKALEEKLTNDSYQKFINLTNDEFLELLHIKWTEITFDNIIEKGEEIINEFIAKLNSLHEKYKDTLEDLNNQIQETEQELSNLLKDLKADEYDQKAIDELIKILEGN